MGQEYYAHKTIACQAPVHRILQARIPEWVAMLFSQPEDLRNPGIEPGSPALQADSLPSEPPGKPIIHINTMEEMKRHACPQF